MVIRAGVVVGRCSGRWLGFSIWIMSFLGVWVAGRVFVAWLIGRVIDGRGRRLVRDGRLCVVGLGRRAGEPSAVQGSAGYER